MNAFVNDTFIFLESYARTLIFQKGEYIFSQGDEPDGCFVVIDGIVITHFFDADIQTEANLQTYTVGDVIGTIGAIRQTTRRISATADTDVQLLHISRLQIEKMKLKNIEHYQQFVDLAANSLARKFQELHNSACETAVSKSRSPVVDATVERANAAQKQFLNWPEEKVAQLLKEIASEVYHHAQSLARQCVEESGMGVAEHKVAKIRLGTLDVAAMLAGELPDTEYISSNNLESLAMPMGVVFGMIPVTNPVETIVFKSLSAMKARNAIIISSHRMARGVGDRTVNIIRDVLSRHGAPKDLVQTPSLPANRKLTQAFMSHEKVHFILATGGPSMVASAYRSGTPAIGVGKGNAPVWISADCDLSKTAATVITSKAFDNGVVCGSENNLLVDTDIADAFLDQTIQVGAAVLTKNEIEVLLEHAFEHNALVKDCIGQSAASICARLGIERDYPIQLIIAEVPAGELSTPLVREKLAPILSMIRIRNEEEALFHARTILSIEGRGHTAIIHSESKDRVRRYAYAVEVSRVLVNSAGTQGCIGACNELPLSWTLGCGTMGGGSTSDNVTYKHLQNTKRIAWAS